jgi:hypothetical protein
MPGREGQVLAESLLRRPSNRWGGMRIVATSTGGERVSPQGTVGSSTGMLASACGWTVNRKQASRF